MPQKEPGCGMDLRLSTLPRGRTEQGLHLWWLPSQFMLILPRAQGFSRSGVMSGPV